jgi:hypothetical protein
MDGIDAGRLIAFATDVTATPGDSGERAEYARLAGRYLSDAAFRMLVDDILEGVGCEVTDADARAGLVLRSRPDGPWAWPAQSGDLPWNKKALTQGERACRMLVIPALLAFIAPSAADYDDLASDPTLRPPDVAVRDLERFIRDFAGQREADSPEPPGGDPPVWWHWLQLQQEAPTPGQQRTSRSDATYLVYEVLEFLHRQHLLIKVRDAPARDCVYRPRRRILAHYRDLLVDDLFASLRQFAGEQGTRHRSSPAADDMAPKG